MPEKSAKRAVAGSWLDRLPYPGYLLTAALAAMLLNLFFFTPRFSLWRGLDLPEARIEPDIDRAVDTLAQLEDPFVRITNPYSYVIQWRLLFPLLGHALGLPPALFLALPHVGCLAALALIVHVIARDAGSRRVGVLVGMLAGGAAWFFVSTGWLSYNDSWLILGLVAAAFLRSRLLLAAATLLCPWIDERFLLLLPVTLGLRGYLLYGDDFLRQVLIDFAAAAAAATPYLAARLYAYLAGTDPVTDTYLHGVTQQAAPFSQLVIGSWMGLRGLWVGAIAFCILAGRLRGSAWRVAMGLVLAGTFVVSLIIAEDVGRSISALLPVGLAGIVLWHRRSPQLVEQVLPWLVIANVLLPGAHVAGRERYPIYYFYTELTRWSQPPDYLTAEFYNRRGVERLQQGELDAAESDFATALQLNPDYMAPRGNQALIHARRGAFESAIGELNFVISHGENLPDALHLRGKCLESTGRRQAAANDYRQALAVAPPDWPSRDEVQQRLEQINGAAGPSR